MARNKRSSRRRNAARWFWRHTELVAGTLTLLLALMGGIAYVVSPSTDMWLLGLLATLPFLVFVIQRGEKYRQRPKDGDHFADHGSGPWSAP